MADVVVDVQQIVVEVRLEIRLGVEPLVIDLVLVGVDHLRLRVLIDNLHVLKERIACYQVVVVAKGDKVALRSGNGLICIFRDLQLLSGIDGPDSRLLLLQLLEKSGERRVRPASVREDELPLRVGLRRKGRDKLTQIVLRRLVERHNNGNERLIRKLCRTLALKLLVGHASVHRPVVVICGK